MISNFKAKFWWVLRVLRPDDRVPRAHQSEGAGRAGRLAEAGRRRHHGEQERGALHPAPDEEQRRPRSGPGTAGIEEAPRHIRLILSLRSGIHCHLV